MADEILVLKGQGNVDVQPYGPGNNWKFLSACAHISGPKVPQGGTEIRWCQDPNQAGEFRISSQFRTAPDQISFDLMTKLGKIDNLKKLNCPFTLRARFANCGTREDASNYDPIMLAYCNSLIQEWSYDDLAIADPGNNDEILRTAPIQSRYEFRIKRLSPSRTGTLAGLGDQPINDIEYCDQVDCGGPCGNPSDGCSIWYGVSDADAAPYAAPNIVKGVKNLITDVITWTNNPILGLNGNAEGIECAGNRKIVSSNADSSIAFNDNDTDQDEWNVVILASAPSANPNALFARTAREIWLGANNGFVYKSVDASETWSAVHSAEITAENINALWAHDKDLVYAACDNGVILKSVNGGETWVDLTEVTTTAANLISVIVPVGREQEVYVGTNDGQIFRSTDEGDTFARMPFTGDRVGTVDKMTFCGPCGSDVLNILHNDAGPRGRILRDFSGGAGGPDVEIVSGYTQVIPTGINLNSIACCDANGITAAGENFGGFPVIIKAV